MKIDNTHANNSGKKQKTEVFMSHNLLRFGMFWHCLLFSPINGRKSYTKYEKFGLGIYLHQMQPNLSSNCDRYKLCNVLVFPVVDKK